MLRKVFFLYLLFPLALSALPTDNPLDASLTCRGVCRKGANWRSCRTFSGNGEYSFRAGFYGDYVFNRKMEVHKTDRDDTIRDTRIYTNAGVVAFNLYNQVEFYTVLGVSKFEFITPEVTWFPAAGTNRLYYLDTDARFSYTLGLRGTLWYCRCFGIGLDGKFFHTNPRLNSGRIEGQRNEYFCGQMKYEEWQVSLGISSRISLSQPLNAYPYGAVKWARSWADFKEAANEMGTHVFVDLETQHEVGYAIGVTFGGGCSPWSGLIEGRFVDELAFHVNVQYRY